MMSHNVMNGRRAAFIKQQQLAKQKKESHASA